MTFFASIPAAGQPAVAIPADRAHIAALDSAVTTGDGVLETLLVRRGVALDLAQHCQRMQLSGALLQLAAPQLAEWEPVVQALVEAWGTGEWGPQEAALRLTATRSGTAFGTLGPVPQQARQQRSGIAVILAPDPYTRDAPYATTMAKTLSQATNLAVRRWAAERGADDVIFTAPDGTITEGPSATVVIASRGQLLTPAAPGLLPPVTAARLSPTERPITVQDLYAADGVYLVSALRLAAPVVQLDGSARAPDASLTRQLQQRLVE